MSIAVINNGVKMNAVIVSVMRVNVVRIVVSIALNAYADITVAKKVMNVFYVSINVKYCESCCDYCNTCGYCCDYVY